MNDMNWNDLRLFYHVAEASGLSGAARATGVSAPTLGRRMLALEAQAGRALFVRAQTGYELTPAGAALLARVRAMEAAAVPVADFLGETEAPMVRISAGTSTAAFLADRFSALQRPGDGFRLHFVTSESLLDISHRQIDLGIRNRPADAANLASRPLGRVAFAPYCSVSAPEPEALDWVALDPEVARHPASRWVHDSGKPIRTIASSVATLGQLVRAGAGIGAMPCMVADCDPALARAGPVIDALTEEVYLVMHNDDRHRPHLRRLITRIVRLYEAAGDLLEGGRPLRSA